MTGLKASASLNQNFHFLSLEFILRFDLNQMAKLINVFFPPTMAAFLITLFL